ncbi:hypothetical protein AMTRI_Chr01g112340 [Amborella trichopoda]|uniref:7,8-dihydroneopterin aldolase n=1 Tax=Amborella trichopoda TaxID=13333 RepID=W1P9Z5_AMBTC|nr:dihydroneopterin aldolase 2 [Amborella trichopoda]XP_011623652.1 dihydroneopterin aldolase 2 [Amborella trichopoda]XP_011623653.1 dihydroneopterin aldolase 2 [Amborella trichopoda]XP_020523234.1 dihydroneopterin aldolase 2 [Amborella trichopoda]XP_020523235.1 dihydroneopterin aldolase 2 [Amborella trichopoda]ERN06702.1 hypothetical protein AMTR_s00058p00214740 [Amborella trichopoda]|eukprot:XP_006845027.1 dihydroneopterin aldolase 2 [Amborella trichopoda]
MDDEEISKGDKLIMRGLKFHGYHGVHEAEKKLGQKFLVDIDAWLDLKKAGETDNLNDTVSYSEIYRLVKGIVEGPSHNLLESVANTIACSILTAYPPITALHVKLGKPHVAVQGTIDYLGVEIYRNRPK